MKILGAKELLNITEPILVYEFWDKAERCRELIKNPTSENILSKIKSYKEKWTSLENTDFHVWIGSNGGQIYPLERDENGEVSITDINVVGDASPRDTLWFVFEESEWEYLDKYIGLELSKILKDIWSDCEKESKYECDNNWAKQELYSEYNLPYKDIIETNIEIKLI